MIGFGRRAVTATARLQPYHTITERQAFGAVRDDDNGWSRRQRAQVYQNFPFACDVDGTCGFVENQQSRMSQDRARQCDALAFAARHQRAAFSDHRIKSRLHAAHEPIGTDGAKRLPHVAFVRLGVGPGEVVPHCVVKQEWILRNITHPLAPGGQHGIVERHTGDGDPALLGREQADKEIGKGRLTGA